MFLAFLRQFTLLLAVCLKSFKKVMIKENLKAKLYFLQFGHIFNIKTSN